jgi:hypothetical protein
VVVVNICVYRCDAFLIQNGQIRITPLPNLELTEAEARAQQLQKSGRVEFDLLEWLWDTIAKPVLETLGFTNPHSNNQ